MKTQTPQRQYRKVHELLRAPVIDLGYEKDRSPGKYNSPTIPIAPQRQRDLSSLLSKLQKEAVKVVRENDRNFYRQTGHQEVSARLSTREDSDQTSSTGHLNITFYLDGHFGKVTPEYTQFENKVKRAFEKFGEKGRSKFNVQSDNSSQRIEMRCTERNGYKIIIEVSARGAVRDYRLTTPLSEDSYRERLVDAVNSGGGWYNGDSNSARNELEEYDKSQRND